MKKKQISLLTMLSLAFILLFGNTAVAAPIFSSFDEFMIPQTGCVQFIGDTDIALFSTEAKQQKPLTHQKLLAILIEFNDVKITMDSEFWNKEMFDTTPGKLSVVNYWKENSNGLDIFEPADTSSVNTGGKGTVSYSDYTHIPYEISECRDGVVRISLDIPHPSPTGDAKSNDLHKVVMMVAGAMEENFDFTVENPYIVTIFAGYGELIAQGTAGKGHIRGFTSGSGIKTPGGISLNRYTVQPEMYSLDIPYGIGTICHELGHSVFNLPDLYFQKAMGADNKYTLMANGNSGRRFDYTDRDKHYDDPYAQCTGHVPTHLDPWCKMQCGFITPTLVNNWDGTINSISDMGMNSKYNVIKVQSKADPKQYFLIENRQLTGFDKGLECLNIMAKYPYDNLFNGGVIIWHIDENVGYSKHNNEAKMHPFISIEQSNNKSAYDYSWAYLNKDGRNTFNSETTPNSNFHITRLPGEKCSLSEDCHPQTVESGISIEVLDDSSPSMRIKVRVDDKYKVGETVETHTHTLVHHAAVAATCTKTGAGEYWKCEGTDACHKMFSDANGLIEIAEIPITTATGHTEVTDTAIAPTCETDGKTAGSHCSVCNTVITEQTIIPKLHHRWGAWMITTEPTFIMTGKAEHICENDNTHKDTIDLPILTDTTVWTEDLKIEPTETENGSVTYTSQYGNVTIIILAPNPKYDYNITYENEKAVITVPQDGLYTVIFAAYDNGKLLAIHAQNIQFVKGENPAVSPQNFNTNSKVKVMLWDSLKEMKPLCEADGNE